jgi:hypothetical protein
MYRLDGQRFGAPPHGQSSQGIPGGLRAYGALQPERKSQYRPCLGDDGACRVAEAPCREFRSLVEATLEYPTATRHILTLNRPGLLPAIPEGILVQTAYEWMLK